jgi:hypothetical protein
VKQQQRKAQAKSQGEHSLCLMEIASNRTGQCQRCEQKWRLTAFLWKSRFKPSCTVSHLVLPVPFSFGRSRICGKSVEKTDPRRWQELQPVGALRVREGNQTAECLGIIHKVSAARWPSKMDFAGPFRALSLSDTISPCEVVAMQDDSSERLQVSHGRKVPGARFVCWTVAADRFGRCGGPKPLVELFPDGFIETRFSVMVAVFGFVQVKIAGPDQRGAYFWKDGSVVGKIIQLNLETGMALLYVDQLMKSIICAKQSSFSDKECGGPA